MKKKAISRKLEQDVFGSDSYAGILDGLGATAGPRVLGAIAANLRGMVFRCAIDADWTLSYVSDGCLSLTGYRVEELLTERCVTLEGMTFVQDRLRVRRDILAARRRADTYRVEYRLQRRDGSLVWVQERGCFIGDPGGATSLEGFIEDISESVALIGQLEEAELRYRSMFDNAAVGMFRTAEDGHYLAANTALAQLYGYEAPGELIADLHDIAHQLYVDPTRREAFKHRIASEGRVCGFESEVHRRGGSTIWIVENAHAVRATDGRVLYYEGTVEDITARRRHQQELEAQATRDALTGLPNRGLLPAKLSESLARTLARGETLALLFVDLDNFKLVNDGLGHAAGDQLIVEVGQRLRATLRDGDTVVRYGGDEFVLLIEGFAPGAGGDALLERLQREVMRPITLAGQRLEVSCSIGVALAPHHGQDLDALLRGADAAMYRAKGDRRGSVQMYSETLHRHAQQRLTLEQALREALVYGEFALAYQLKVDALGRATSCEALLRWNSPALGVVSPARFIPVAEETGLIIPLSDFVLEQACCALAEWRAAGSDLGRVAVNLSASHFREPGLVLASVKRALALSGLEAQHLEVEITESALMGDLDRATEALSALRALGVSVALDDFGTGYSSLAYLRRLPVDTLKIDRSFVSACDREYDARSIARAVVALGHSLGKEVVAEGVETPGQFRMLAEAGCDEFQGFLFSRPSRADAMKAFLLGHATA